MRIFDSHFHIIDHRYPLQKNQGFLPEKFLVEDYCIAMQPCNLIGGIMVSGSFHGFDYSYLEPALCELGPTFFAVVQAPTTIDETTIRYLHSIGVRGIRFNFVRGNRLSVKKIQELAYKVHAIAGWHSEFYINACGLEELRTVLATLPSVSIDHLGLSYDASKHVIYLAEQGVKIKASGFGRVDFDIGTALQNIHHANRNSLMFGSDLPSTRAAHKFSTQDIKIIEDLFSPEEVKRILYQNALEFYRIEL